MASPARVQINSDAGARRSQEKEEEKKEVELDRGAARDEIRM